MEPSGGCGVPICTDNDSDTYAIEGGSCGPVDCNDDDASVWQLNSCGACAPEPSGGCGPENPHANLLWVEYPTNCMSCHDGGEAGGNHYEELLDSTHYKWLGDTPDMVNQTHTQQGKLTNAVNSYCINIEGDWPVCGSCHVGRGEKPGEETNGPKASIDCLVCHNADYAENRVRLPDDSMGPAEGTDQTTMDGYVQNISPPTRTNCLKCHAFAGGGDGVKRGDLSWALTNNIDAHFDVHMNSAGVNLQCQDCHVFENHKVIGKGSDLRPTDDLTRGSELTCANSNCHVGMDSGSGHGSAGRNDAPDRHVARVACQSCHIPEYAKFQTETHRDWRFHHNAPHITDCDPNKGNTPCPGHPETIKEVNLVPVLKFWNRESDNYLLGDIAVMDPDTSAYPTSRPMGDINDGKLTPFKYKTADQPMTDNNELIALDTLEYLKKTGDLQRSIESGLVNMGKAANTPVSWVMTDTYQMINHGVNPVSEVAACSHCHEEPLNVDTDSKLDFLGYNLKGPKEDVCNQCHDGSKKLPRTVERVHSHIEKGSTGIGCAFCHDFERPERGLCSPCDTNNCKAEYVDNVAYPHQCN